MTKIIEQRMPEETIGLDLSDRTARYCILDAQGTVREEAAIHLDPASLRRFVARLSEQARFVFEAGGHSHWVARQIQAMGREAIVANPRDLAAVTDRKRRDDRRDARQLARLGRIDPDMLHPVELRAEDLQMDLGVIRTRALLVETRTRLIVQARSLAKSAGCRLPSGSADSFAARAADTVPEALRPAILPAISVIETITAKIEELDDRIERLIAEKYPEALALARVPAVGKLTALAFVLTIGDPTAIEHSRDAGAVLGMVPKRRQSGKQDPELGITRSGDTYLRKLLVQCAHVLLGRFGRDCALRQWAMARLVSTKGAKKKIVVAVARKLAVILHRLWVRGEEFQAFPAAA